jgi:8-amino-7-oxononanoate synthase
VILRKRRKNKLLKRELSHLKRTRLVLNSPQGTRIKLNDDKNYLNFASNDYLGLASSSRVVAALHAGYDKFGVSSAASDMVIGYSSAHKDLAQKISQLINKERVLIFANGFMANLAICKTLYTKNDVLYQDKLNHNSLLSGGLASAAKLVRFYHCDKKHLQQRIVPIKTGAIVSESVFSMDGDIAPLKDYFNIAKKNNLELVIDDAHGFGVQGLDGLKTIKSLPNDDDVIYMATFGKALGCYGAFVAGDKITIETLMQNSAEYIYTTALPPAFLYAADVALDLLQQEQYRISKLHENIIYFKRLAATNNLHLQESTTAIQTMIIGDSKQTIFVANNLKKLGIITGAIRYPTVPKNTDRLRITLSSAHSKTQIKKLVSAIKTTSKHILTKKTCNYN